MSDASTPANRLTVEGLVKRYGQRAPALAGLSFAAAPGEFIALLGPSGAGKTTLLRCLLGLTPADAGSIRLGSHDIVHGGRGALHEARRETAVIFQQFNLISRLSAVENVLAGRLTETPLWRALLRRFPRSERMRALYALERVGLLALAYRRADTLSGGQQQRVAVARALAQRSTLILADEPVASLDPESAAAVLGALRSACDEDGATVLCSLHQVGVARRFATRTLGLAAGRLVVDAPAAALDAALLRAIYHAGGTAP